MATGMMGQKKNRLFRAAIPVENFDGPWFLIT